MPAGMPPQGLPGALPPGLPPLPPRGRRPLGAGNRQGPGRAPAVVVIDVGKKKAASKGKAKPKKKVAPKGGVKKVAKKAPRKGAKKKPSPAQLKAREKFIEMVTKGKPKTAKEKALEAKISKETGKKYVGSR
jgi:hypothetical protein